MLKMIDELLDMNFRIYFRDNYLNLVNDSENVKMILINTLW